MLCNMDGVQCSINCPEIKWGMTLFSGEGCEFESFSSNSLIDLDQAIYRSLPDSPSFHHKPLFGCMLELSCFEQTSTSPK